MAIHGENPRDGKSQPAWVAEQLSLFTAAIGVRVGFVRKGEANAFDHLPDFCEVYRSDNCPRQADCLSWHELQRETIGQSNRAIQIQCPMNLNHLWAPVSKAGVIYGFLYTEPVRTAVAASDGGGGTKKTALDGVPMQGYHVVNRGAGESFQSGLRVKSAQRDGQLLLLELVAQRLGARFHEEERLPVDLDPSESLVRRAEAILSSHFHENISTCDIASQLHVSESHLCHAFHGVTGGTLREYLNELRFTEACRLLRERPRLTVAEVAFSAGFQSLSRFSEQFRRRNLPSPGKWRHSRES